MVCGKPPFTEADTPMAIPLRHVNERPRPPRDVEPSLDPALSDWIERLLVKDPKERPGRAAAVWDELEEIVIGLLGPRWRRDARLVERAPGIDTPRPLTPAPFRSTH